MVLTDFLKGQIVKVANEGSGPENKKKRYYNNSKRAAAAEAAKRLKHQTWKSEVSRLPRNSEDSLLLRNLYLLFLKLSFVRMLSPEKIIAIHLIHFTSQQVAHSCFRNG